MDFEAMFMDLAPMIETEDGEIAYLRMGKGLLYAKVWCDYVRADNDERVYLPDEFYPTMKDAVKALYDKICD